MKAVLILEMPERCSICRFKCETNEGYAFCVAPGFGFDYQVNEFMTSKLVGKPSWCPLRKLPERKNTVMGDAYPDGWNDCLNEIEN